MKDCMANWSLVLEYLKVLLSWPPITLLLAVFMLPMFGTPLSNLIRNVRKGKAGAFEFEVEPEQQKAKAPPNINENDRLSVVSHNPDLARQEILKWWSAALFENVFHKIFGTQVKLLEYLESKEPLGDTEANLMAFFNDHQKQAEILNSQVRSPDFSSFIGFLQQQNFLVSEARDGIPFVRISDLGKNFLAYTKSTWGAYASTRAL